MIQPEEYEETLENIEKHKTKEEKKAEEENDR